MPMGKMYMYKPTKKKKTQKKQIKKAVEKAVQKGVTSYSSIRTRSLIPKKAVLTFPYVALDTLATQDASVTPDFTSKLYRLNDIYDPDNTILGDNNITATGFAHIFGTAGSAYKDGIYQDFTVLRTKVHVTFVNEEDSQGVICATYINSVNSADLDYRSIANQPKWYSETILGPRGNNNVRTLRRKFDMAKFVGSDVRDLEEYRGNFSSSPSNIAYLYVMARNLNDELVSNNVQVRIKLEYTVECTLPRDLEKGF